MTNETKLWQLRAGIITEGEYVDSMEELGTSAENPVRTTSSVIGGNKPATSASQLGADVIKKGQDMKKQGNVIQGGEAAELDNIIDQLVTMASDPKNRAVTFQRIKKFIQQMKG